MMDKYRIRLNIQFIDYSNKKSVAWLSTAVFNSF